MTAPPLSAPWPTPNANRRTSDVPDISTRFTPRRADPAAALIEIMNTDGTMARLPELEKVAKEYDLKLISIKDLIAYRMTQRDIEGADGLQDPIPADAMVTRGETVFLPTAYGEFELTPFRQLSNGLEHIALVKGTWEKDEPILCRVHSSCATGDIFGSKRCECGEQLHRAMQMVQEAGKGIIVYMNQEGRGIGLMNKISAYKLRLMTNNPVKRVGLESYGIEIVENIPIEIAPNPYNERYMRTKKEKMHHNLHLV